MKTYTVYEVIYHVADDSPQAYGGAAGDGSFIDRFKKESEAIAFAKCRNWYGQRASVTKVDGVPRRLAQRWGLA